MEQLTTHHLRHAYSHLASVKCQYEAVIIKHHRNVIERGIHYLLFLYTYSEKVSTDSQHDGLLGEAIVPLKEASHQC